MNDFLMHAGVSKRDGAKVGSGRYPLGSGKRPYQGTGGKPMSRREQRRQAKKAKKNSSPEKLSKEEFTDEIRQDIIARGDVKAAFANRQYMSNQDIDNVIARYEKESKLKGLAVKDIKTGKDYIDKITDYMNTATRFTSAGIGLYNNTAKIVNAMGDSNLPIIGAEKKKN